MRDCKRFFKGMSIVPYIIMVWLPLFFSWRETVEQIRLPDARQIGLLLFCCIDNDSFVCYPLPISRYFYFEISISAETDVYDFRGIPA